MNEPSSHTGRSWVRKFRDAFRGMKEGIRGQSSFFVHFFVAALVLVAGGVMQIDRLWEWAILLLCITTVLTAEMFNSALEHMARAITDQTDRNIGTALDIGSAAVLTASLGAAAVGVLIFGQRLAGLLGWW